MLEQVGFVDVLDRVRLLADRRRQRVDADGAASELLDDGEQQPAVDVVEAVGVDVEERERVLRNHAGYRTARADQREIAHAAKQSVGDARGAARALGDLLPARGVERHVEDARRASPGSARGCSSV